MNALWASMDSLGMNFQEFPAIWKLSTNCCINIKVVHVSCSHSRQRFCLYVFNLRFSALVRAEALTLYAGSHQ